MKFASIVVSAALAALYACAGGRTAPLGPDDAGADASTCSPGSIRFALVSMSLTTYCIGAPYACTHDWLFIRRASGEDLTIDRPCVSDCASCGPVACPALCAAPTRIPSGGVQRTWDGVYYTARKCGAGTSCVDRACAAAGRYVATMCAYRDLSTDAPPALCAPEMTPTCTEIAFDWPTAGGSSDLVGIIADGPGPKCCPAGWPLYACAYPDGGTGTACHDPAMGCASSSTCGDGCDFVVAGRCSE